MQNVTQMLLVAGLNNAAKCPLLWKLLKIHDKKSHQQESEPVKLPCVPSSNSWML